MPTFHKEIVQGTPEWNRVRLGIPTASQVHRLITPGLKPSKSAEMYLFELLSERLLGEPTDPYISTWMGRGSDLEEEAVNYYELFRDCDTEPVGFVSADNGRWGVSPDRLCNPNGLLEVKVPKPAVHVGYLLQSGTAYAEHGLQTQMQLWVSEKEWNDLLSYCPGLPPAIHRVERDDKVITAIAAAVTAFSDELERQYGICKANGWVHERPQIKRTIEPLGPLDDLVKEAMKRGVVVP